MIQIIFPSELPKSFASFHRSDAAAVGVAIPHNFHVSSLTIHHHQSDFSLDYFFVIKSFPSHLKTGLACDFMRDELKYFPADNHRFSFSLRLKQFSSFYSSEKQKNSFNSKLKAGCLVLRDKTDVGTFT